MIEQADANDCAFEDMVSTRRRNHVKKGTRLSRESSQSVVQQCCFLCITENQPNKSLKIFINIILFLVLSYPKLSLPLRFLVNYQRDAQFFSMYLSLFLTLYMFRAHRAHHQERQIVSIQPLVAVGGRVVGRSEVNFRPAYDTATDSYQRLY